MSAFGTKRTFNSSLRMSAIGGKADMTDANNRWDNLKNKHWNTMGRLANVGHAKDFKSEKFLTPPLGTTTKNRFGTA